MAAVRCAARRLGGALLQRAHAEERRRLVPRRLMSSRDLSTEQVQEIQQKKEALYEAVANAELKRKEFNDALIKAGDPTGEKHLDAQVAAQRTGYERLKMYGRRAQGVLDLTLKVTFHVVLAVAFVRICRDKREDMDSGETTTEVQVAN